jgi:hypothetical protein
VFEASTFRGAPIVQFDPHFGPNQRFRFSQRG